MEGLTVSFYGKRKRWKSSEDESTHKRVDEVTDTLFTVGSPRSHGVVRVVLRASDRSSKEV